MFAADDSGVKGDGITNIAQPRITGTADPNATIQLLDSFGNLLTSTTTSASGGYTITIPAPLGNGPAPFRVRELDFVGNLSAPSAATNLVIDLIPPAAPSTPTLLPADDSGTLGDGITSVTQPRLIGTAVAGSTVQLVNGSTVIGTATVSAGGAYTVSPSSPLASGTYSLTVQDIDVAGNVSTPSGAFSLTILSGSLATPPAPTLLATDDSGVSGDNTTNVRQPHLTGTASGGVTIQIVGAGGAILGTAPIGPGGSYTVAVASPLADGTYSLSVQSIDAAGNLSTLSPALGLTILATPPAAPSAPVLFPADDSGTLGDGITNVNQPRLTGTAVAGDTVLLLNASNAVIGSTVATSGGLYTVIPSSPLADGSYVLHTVTVDVAGNVSSASGTIALTILTAPPAAPGAPALLAADDSGVVGDGIRDRPPAATHGQAPRRPRISSSSTPRRPRSWERAPLARTAFTRSPSPARSRLGLIRSRPKSSTPPVTSASRALRSA